MVIAIFILMIVITLGGVAVFLVKTNNTVREWVGLKALDPDEKAREATRKKVEELNRRSDQQRLGYRFADDNPFLFIHGSGVWTGVIMPTYNDDFTSASQQEAGFDGRSQVYRNLLDFVEAQKGGKQSVVCHEIMRYQPVDASGWESEYLQNAWSPSSLFRELVHDHVRPQLEHTSPEARRFLLIRLGDFKGRTNVDPLTMVLESADHVTEEHFRRSNLDAFRRQAAELHDHLGIEPASRADLSWIIRKVLAGHFDPNMERDVVATRPWRAGYFDQIVDFSGKNLSHFVEIDNPDMSEDNDEQSYVATLIVADSDPVLPFRYDGAWGKAIRTLDYPVGISWRYTLMTGEKWAKECNRKIGSILDEAEDRAKAGKDNDELFNVTLAEAAEIKRQNEVNPDPAMVGQLRFTVAAASPRELETAVTQLRSTIKDMTLTQPRRIQHALLREQLPGDPEATHVGRINMATSTSLGIDVGTRWNNLDALAVPRLESVPNVGDSVEYTRGGTTLGWRGHLIGYSRVTGAAVHFDPHVQIDRHNGAGVGIIGFSGGGKSSLALTLFFWMSESGTQCVAIDPKNDFQAFCYYIAFGPQVLDPGFEEEQQKGVLGTAESAFEPINREFWDETDIIDLLRGPRGMLGAWEITDSYEEGEALAWAQLELLLPNERDRNTLIDGMYDMRGRYEEALAKKESYTPSLSELRLYLRGELEEYGEAGDKEKNSDVASRIQAREKLTSLRALEQRLANAETAAYARLLFSDPGASADNGFKSVRKRRTILTLFGFTPPDPTKTPDRWSTSERDAAAAIFTALHSINEFFINTTEALNPTTGRRERLKRALFIDEGYIITAIEAGRDLVVKALRQGRSLRFAVIFISQQAADVQMIEKQSSEEGEADQNQFGTVFVFQQRGMAEARAALALLREHEKDDSARNVIARRLLPESNDGHLSRGVCVMRDVDNRVAVMHVDPMFEELYAAEQTESRQRAIQQLQQLPSRGRDWSRDTSVRDAVRRASESGAGALDNEYNADGFEFDGYDFIGASS
ncbi:MAG: ATP-binding protein [Tomitella sp.]|nr:ATP-binding protein [Tomitella sp.]